MLEHFDPKAHIEYLVNEIRTYFLENGPTSKAVIGISGGKDSTITAALLVRALGAQRVIGVLMPEGEQEDIADSYQVCKMLGIHSYEMNIDPVCFNLYSQLKNCNLKMNDTITTNTPARIRMSVLYMVAAAVGGRVINTCNRSEEYVGYSTKYGDLAGDYGVLMDYTVTEIFAIGDALQELPYDLVHKVPVDGMCGKTDEENLGMTYKTIDRFLLDGVIPDEPTYKKMKERNQRNRHKEAIRIPHPRSRPEYTKF